MKANRNRHTRSMIPCGPFFLGTVWRNRRFPQPMNRENRRRFVTLPSRIANCFGILHHRRRRNPIFRKVGFLARKTEREFDFPFRTNYHGGRQGHRVGREIPFSEETLSEEQRNLPPCRRIFSRAFCNNSSVDSVFFDENGSRRDPPRRFAGDAPTVPIDARRRREVRSSDTPEVEKAILVFE